MSNYRVRQVLALGPMPERQLRLLVALATWLPDDTRTVSVGFDALMKATGQTRNTVRDARRELEASGRISSQTSRGRGKLAVWTVHCLPEKGVSEFDPFTAVDNDTKGVSEFDPFTAVDNPPEKGSTGGEKRVTYPAADLREPDHWLNRRAKPSLSSAVPLAAQLAAAVPGATERETDLILQRLRDNPDVRAPAAYLRAAISNGDAPELVTSARAELRRRRPARRPWCGRCSDEITRQVGENPVRRCPDCHPLAGAGMP